MHTVGLDREKLKNLRKTRGLGLTQVAEANGLTPQQLWNYENDHGMPPGDVLLRLLSYYRVTNHEVSKKSPATV